ncbi:MAG: tellurite resistance TerB family protein [Candidatus Nanopelagicales bacterium]
MPAQPASHRSRNWPECSRPDRERRRQPMPLPQAHQQASALVKAMINAAKADGEIDAEEQEKIVAKLTDLGPQETAFVQDELNKPLNFDFFADITQDMAPQVYAVSLMAINLDTPAESSYMQQLAQGLGLDPQTVNAIHAQLGLAPLYA